MTVIAGANALRLTPEAARTQQRCGWPNQRIGNQSRRVI